MKNRTHQSKRLSSLILLLFISLLSLGFTDKHEWVDPECEDDVVVESLLLAPPTVSNKTLALGQGILNLLDLGTECVSGVCLTSCNYIYYEYGYACESSTDCSQVSDLSRTSSIDYGSIRFNNTRSGTFTYEVMQKRRAAEPDIGTPCTVPDQISETSDFDIVVWDWKWNTVASDECLNDPGQTYNLKSMISHTSGVSYSGDGVSDSTLNTAGLPVGIHTVTASKSFSNGTKSISFNFEIFQNPTVTFTPPSHFCDSDVDQNLIGYVNVTGGSFMSNSENLVLYGANNRMIDISASVVGGPYSVEYTYTDGNGCEKDATALIYLDPQNVVDAGASQESCENSGNVALAAVTPGVTWSCVDCSYVSGSNFNTNTAPPDVYIVRASKTVGGCSDTNDKTFTVNALPTVNAGNNFTVCTDNPSFNLSGESPTGGVWSSTCGSCLSGSLFSPANAGVGPHTITYSYTDANSCLNSDPRVITVDALPVSGSISTSGDTRCGAGTVNLTASLTGNTIRWYAGSSGGSSLATGNSYSPSIGVGVSTFYVEAENGNGCFSNTRKAVTAEAYAVPANPTGVDGERCGTEIIVLGANGSGAGASYRWYENASGGSILFTGASFPTPSLTSTRDYYVDALSTDGCLTVARTQVTATVNSIPGTPTTFDDSNCGSGTVNLSVGGTPAGGSYAWYLAATGGSSINSSNSYSPALAVTTSYFVSVITAEGCEGAREEIIGTIYPSPPTPLGVDDDRCGSGTVNMSVTGTNAAQFDWYDTEASAISLHTGNLFSPGVASSRSYWVEMLDNNGCFSSRDEVFVTIHPIPVDPTVPSEGRCGTGTIDLTASGSGAGAVYDWYENAVGGSSLFTGPTFTTPSLTTSKSYYVEATSTDGCISVIRTEVVAVINSIPGLPLTNDGESCGPGSVNLTVSGAPAGGSYNWYPSNSGGSSFNTTNSHDANIASSESYWVSIVSAEGCEGGRAEIFATINDIPSVPIGTDDERCESGSVNLSASAGIVGTFNWYATEASVTILFSGENYVTGVLSSSTSFWVEVVSPEGCASSKTEVFATINAIPSEPIAPDVENCGPGQVDLIASGGPVGSTYDWFDNATGGSSVFTGSIFQPTVTLSRSYFVEVTSIDGCTSVSRTEVEVTINPLPSEPVVFDGENCGPGIVNLTVVGTPAGGDYRWYPVAVGGVSENSTNTYDVTISTTTSYWVSIVTAENCEGPREEIIATIHDIPAVPSGVDGDRCGTGTVALSASSAVGGSFNWYDTEFSVISLFTGVNFTTPTLTTTSGYWVDVTDINGCVSTRTEVVATVFPIPVDPTASDVGRCGSGNVTMSASGSGVGAIYDWYTSSTGGISLFTAADFTIFVSSSRSYYVEATSTDGCISANRTEVEITINTIPGLPTVTDNANCGTGTVLLTAAGVPAGGEYRWYDAETGGVSFNNTNSINPGLSSTTSYWVSIISDQGCEGDRAEVIATINSIPLAPTGNDGVRCGDGTVTLSAASGVTGSFNWYDTEFSATNLFTGVNFTTPPLTNTSSYWVEFTDLDGCTSPRTEVTATILTVIPDPIVPDIDRCGAGQVIITASSSTQGAIFDWYDNQFGGSSIFTGPSLTTTLSLSRNYYVEATSAEGCESENRTPVTVTINPLPSAPGVTGGNTCGTGTVMLSASGAPAGGNYNWYDTDISTTVIGTGSGYETISISSTRSYYVAIVNEFGCEGNRSEIEATVDGFPSAPSVSDVQRCGIGDVELDAINGLAGATVNWYLNSSGGSPFATGTSITIDDLDETTTYYASTLSAEGCESGRVSLTATIDPIIEANIGGNIQVCLNGDPYDLSQDLVDVSTGNGFFIGEGVIGTNLHPSIAGLGNKEITFVLQDEIGCLTDGSRFITIVDITVGGEGLTLSTEEITHCMADGTLNLNDLPSVPGGSWTSDASPSSLSVGIFDPTISGPGEYIATYSVDINGCTVIVTLDLNITDSPETPILSGPGTACVGETVTLSVDNVNASSDVYSWFINDEVSSFTTGSSIEVLVEEHVTYKVSVENVFGCSAAIAEWSITADDILVEFSGTPTVISAGERIEFSADVEGESFFWDFGDGLNSTEKSPGHFYFNEGMYDVSLTVTTAEGCEGTLEKLAYVTVSDEQTVTGLVDGFEAAQVYPQPFNSFVYVKINSSKHQNASLYIYNISGTRVKQKEVSLRPGENVITFENVSDLARGVYLLRMEDEDGKSINRKLLKQD